MGTTLVALVFLSGEGFRVHAGDSRLYRFRGGLLTQITRDHSLREETGDPSVPANIITNSLGAGEYCFGEVSPLADQVRLGDRFLLCSDGLHDYVNRDRIELAFAAREGVAAALVKLAHAAGAPDNVSAVILEITDAT